MKKEKIKNKMQKPLRDGAVSLIRYGGLNIVKQKGNYGNKTYHSAPEKFGYYAFIFPYIELFLIGSTKVNEFNAGMRKEFHAVDGFIWTHFKPDNQKDILAVSNDWYKVPVSVMNKIIRKVYAEESAINDTYYHYEDFFGERKLINPSKPAPKAHRNNPYSYCSTDHMEVFVCRETIIK